jgi:hypothetical protein
LHPAVAGDGDFAGGVGARDELPAGAFAVGAILDGHADSIRLQGWNGKLGVWEFEGRMVVTDRFFFIEFAEGTEKR